MPGKGPHNAGQSAKVYDQRCNGYPKSAKKPKKRKPTKRY